MSAGAARLQVSTGRRRLVSTVAAAATVALVVMLSLPGMARGDVIPTTPPVPTLPVPLPTPTPTACLQPSATASPSPGPSPGCPTASASSGAAAGTPSPQGATQPGGATGPATPSAATHSAVIVPSGIGALITDPSLVAQLDSVLNQPLHLQRPALRHFVEPRPPDPHAAGRTDGTAATLTGATWRGLLPALLVAGLAAAAALAVLVAAWLSLRRTRRNPSALRPGRWRRRLLVAAGASRRNVIVITTGAAVAAGAVLVGLTRGAAPVAARPAVISAHHVQARAAATTSPAALASRDPAWSQLVGIEDDVAAQQAQLTLVENRITNLAESSADHLEPPLRGSGSDRRLGDAAALVALLDARQRTIDAYQASLQREYQFYVTAAQTPVVRAAVVTAAAVSTPASAVVSYNLQEVGTQLQQEQAISAAQAGAAAKAERQILVNGRSPKFSSPVGGVVSQGFGATLFALEPSLTYHGVFFAHFHTGLDIANTLDTPVGTAAPGRVILAGSSRDPLGNLVGYGNYVVVDHGGGFLTLYGHLDRLVVTTGQLVQRGQEVGFLGSTGWSTGPHLHFEIRHDGDLIDPATLLKGAIR